MTITINQADLKRLERKLGTIGAKATLRPVMKTSLDWMQRDIAKYPRKAKGAFSALATKKQKQAFWARVGSGEIDFREGVGYVRTGNTGRKWTTRIFNLPNGLQGFLGTFEPHAKYVQGDKDQQLFHHVSGWRTDRQVIKMNEKRIVDRFQRTIRVELNK